MCMDMLSATVRGLNLKNQPAMFHGFDLRTRRAVLTGIEGDTWTDQGGYIKVKQICKKERGH